MMTYTALVKWIEANPVSIDYTDGTWLCISERHVEIISARATTFKEAVELCAAKIRKLQAQPAPINAAVLSSVPPDVH